MGPDAPVEIASQVGVTSSRYFEGRPSAALIAGWRATPRFGLDASAAWAAPGDYGDAGSVILAAVGNGQQDYTDSIEVSYAKVGSSAHLVGRWTALAGAASLVDTVDVPLEFYIVGGVGIAEQRQFALCPPTNWADGPCPGEPAEEEVVQQDRGSELELTPVVGFGLDLFVSRLVAVKLDVRDTLIVDPTYRCCFAGSEPSTTLHAYGNVVSTVGLMVRPRLRAERIPGHTGDTE